MIIDNRPPTGVSHTIDTQPINSADKNSFSSSPTQHEEPEITRAQLSLSKRFFNWRTLLPLVIVIAALVFFAQRANIDIQKIWQALRTANPLFFAAAFFIYYASFIIRALRWRVLLQNVGYTKENNIYLPPLWKLTEIIYISFFTNSVVPAKLGDLYRAYLLREDIKVPITRSFGTVLAERMLDLIVLLLMFIPAIIFTLSSKMPPQLLLSLEILFALVIVGIVALFVLRLAKEKIAHLVPQRFRAHYYDFQEGTLGSFKRLPSLAGLTTAVWTCEALRFFFIALSLNLISGEFTHILAAAVFIGLGEALLSAIPSTGGGVGLVEAGMLAMISLFYTGPDATNLTAAAVLLDRIITLFSILIIGFFVFLFAFGRKQRRSDNKVLQESQNKS